MFREIAERKSVPRLLIYTGLAMCLALTVTFVIFTEVWSWSTEEKSKLELAVKRLDSEIRGYEKAIYLGKYPHEFGADEKEISFKLKYALSFKEEAEKELDWFKGSSLNVDNHWFSLYFETFVVGESKWFFYSVVAFVFVFFSLLAIYVRTVYLKAYREQQSEIDKANTLDRVEAGLRIKKLKLEVSKLQKD